jgi:hypothetical protein
MNYPKKIEALEAKRELLETKRELLEAQVTMKGLDKEEKHDIRQQICNYTNEIFAYTTEITALYGRLAPPPDERWIGQRVIDEMSANPVAIGAPAIVSTTLASWAGVRDSTTSPLWYGILSK